MTGVSPDVIGLYSTWPFWKVLLRGFSWGRRQVALAAGIWCMHAWLGSNIAANQQLPQLPQTIIEHHGTWQKSLDMTTSLSLGQWVSSGVWTRLSTTAGPTRDQSSATGCTPWRARWESEKKLRSGWTGSSSGD